MSIYIPGVSLGHDYPIKLTVWPDGRFNAVVDDVLLSCGKAIELPPHGRLGDLDALDDKLLQDGFGRAITRRKSTLTYGDARQYVQNAETIIPADGAGKEKSK